MTFEELVRKQAEEEEGNVPYAYVDTLGYTTIGIGFLIDKRKGGLLYPEEINFIFQNRLSKLMPQLLKALPWVSSLDDVRKAALVNMSYQMGVQGLVGFPRMLQSIQAGDWMAASVRALDSVWAKQTPERAKRVAEQLRTGVAQWH